ncbi:RDD family protein [Ectobacillus polymachus]|uniref:RDD family protein n=1 Tax=Ectobacillus polymachus TaxID=1508806 RepID=UPI003A8A1ED8
MKLRMNSPAIIMNRVGATLLDMFIISLVYGVIVAILTGNYKDIFARFGVSTGDYRFDLIIVCILMFLYFILLPLFWNGLTVGKKVTRLRIVKMNGERLDFVTLFVRLLVIIVPSVFLLGIPVIISAYMIMFREDARGYHDLIARTRVKSSL